MGENCSSNTSVSGRNRSVSTVASRSGKSCKESWNAMALWVHTAWVGSCLYPGLPALYQHLLPNHGQTLQPETLFADAYVVIRKCCDLVGKLSKQKWSMLALPKRANKNDWCLCCHCAGQGSSWETAREYWQKLCWHFRKSQGQLMFLGHTRSCACWKRRPYHIMVCADFYDAVVPIVEIDSTIHASCNFQDVSNFYCCGDGSWIHLVLCPRVNCRRSLANNAKLIVLIADNIRPGGSSCTNVFDPCAALCLWRVGGASEKVFLTRPFGTPDTSKFVSWKRLSSFAAVGNEPPK